LVAAVRVLFGHCTFDNRTRELFRNGEPVHLSPKAFRLLDLLIEAQPNALSKEEIHQRLWPDTFVSETNLAGLVKEIRAAIGDDSKEPRFLRTIHRYGYAFSGAARETRGERSAIEYRLIVGPREIALNSGENILGRDHDAVVWIEGKSVSRQHARIVISNGTATIEDLGSKNGTFVGGVATAGAVPLHDGAQIALGKRVVTFRMFPAAASTETEEDGSR
jgi:DNA-binding winged helix-turn-helix (wHTH) protein